MNSMERHMRGIERAFAKTPEERMETLMASPYWELNQKYAARTEIRNLERKIKYTKEQIDLAERKAEMMQAQIDSTNAEIVAVQKLVEVAKAAAEKAKQEAFMKNLRANAAIKEFTAKLKAPADATAKPPVAAPVAPVPAKSAADVLQDMINKKYRLK